MRQRISLGSSPRPRGAPRFRPGRVGGGGIIPASAGSTPFSAGTCGWRRDHPRVRGEHARVVPHDQGVVGIIPASAGSTPPWRRRSTHGSDHPRVRGEHHPVMTITRSRTGSSPRPWGAHGHGALPFGWLRIIPASAGSTASRPSPACSRRDHPRVRGEHSLDGMALILLTGSSPRPRGAPEASSSETVIRGIIPASAGSTHLCPATARVQMDHPRVRGEHGR